MFEQTAEGPTLTSEEYDALTKGLSVEERMRGYLLSAEADHTLRSGTEMTEDERKLLTDGAKWERSMHRVFKGICTRRERREALRRSAASMGVNA
jgi:hypothetical protein